MCAWAVYFISLCVPVWLLSRYYNETSGFMYELMVIITSGGILSEMNEGIIGSIIRLRPSYYVSL